MAFEAIFQRFVETAPPCVMHRALMENFFALEKLSRLFRDVAQVQHERELLFSNAVKLTSQVDCRIVEKHANGLYGPTRSDFCLDPRRSTTNSS
jgi:hypothetical protein